MLLAQTLGLPEILVVLLYLLVVGYLGWLGGLPLDAFESLGFERRASFDDPYILAEPEAVPESAVAECPAESDPPVRRS